MKILFLCNCLEPGRDGVGDYARRLAAELIKQGHECRGVATHDRYVSKWTEERDQFPGLRMPKPIAVERIRSWLSSEGFGPGEALLSFQFVSFYPYHQKGFPLVGRLQFLAPLTSGYRLHLMAHELWLDFHSQKLWKRKLLGRWQRRVAQRLFKALRPVTVHTTIPVYASRLRELGWDAAVLPLPGNIPVTAPNGWTVRTLNHSSSQKDFLAVVFGAVHGNWEPENFLSWLTDWLAERQKQLILVFIGRNGPLAAAKIAQLQKTLGIRVSIKVLGEQPPENISDLLQTAEVGISTNPWGGNGKSGTVAAMLEHGLPAITTTASQNHEIDRPLQFLDGPTFRQNFASIQRIAAQPHSPAITITIEQLDRQQGTAAIR